MTYCETSSCSNVQWAICLHCTKRLCSSHILIHCKSLSSDNDFILQMIRFFSQELSNIVKSMDKALTDTKILSNQWEFKRVPTLNPTCSKSIQEILSQEKYLREFDNDTARRLLVIVIQPFSTKKIQQNIDASTIKNIQNQLEMIESEIEAPLLKQNPIPKATENVPILNETENISLENTQTKTENFSSTSIRSVEQTQSQSESLRNETSANLSFSSAICPNIIIQNGKSASGSKRLLKMLSKIPSGEKNKNEIHQFMKNPNPDYGLPALIKTYITAWHKKKLPIRKESILNEYLPVITTYVTKKRHQIDVILGIQVFFSCITYKDNKVSRSEVMTLLLKFFLEKNCISKAALRYWYNSEDVFGYIGFVQAKQLAEPFLQSLEHTGEQATAEVSSFINLKSSCSAQFRTLRNWEPSKRIIKFFKTPSLYDEERLPTFRGFEKNKQTLTVLVRSYLQTWASTSEPDEKDDILKKGLKIIKKYFQRDKDKLCVMYALQLFMYNIQSDDFNQLFLWLVGFFRANQLIDEATMTRWYINGHRNRIVGFDEIKQWAEPYLNAVKSPIDNEIK